MNKKILLFLKFLFTSFILILFVFSYSQAIMIKLSLRKLTTEADAIILGKVMDIQSQWSVDKSVILTIVKLHVHEILKGKINNDQILIQYPGGEVVDIGLKVSDMPTFQQDEIVLVFLKSITDIEDTKHSPMLILNMFPAFSIFGAAQGKYSIDSNGIARKSEYNLISEESELDIVIPLETLKAKIMRIQKRSPQKKEKIHENIKK